MSGAIDLHPVEGDGRVIVRRDPDQAQTAAGVVIPIVCRAKDTTGEVLAVHSGVVRPCQVKVGERVLFGKYAGTDIRWRGELVTIMPEAELLAVLDDDLRCMFCGKTKVHECTGGTYRKYREIAGELVSDDIYVQVFPGLVDADAYAEDDTTKRLLRGGVFDVRRSP